MARLRKLDSFLKELQRANPLLPLTFRRVVLADTVLYDDVDDDDDDVKSSTGGGGGGGNDDRLKRKPVTVPPRGLYIAAANSAIARDPRLLDGSRDLTGFALNGWPSSNSNSGSSRDRNSRDRWLGSRVGW